MGSTGIINFIKARIIITVKQESLSSILYNTKWNVKYCMAAKQDCIKHRVKQSSWCEPGALHPDLDAAALGEAGASWKTKGSSARTVRSLEKSSYVKN